MFGLHHCCWGHKLTWHWNGGNQGTPWRDHGIAPVPWPSPSCPCWDAICGTRRVGTCVYNLCANTAHELGIYLLLLLVYKYFHDFSPLFGTRRARTCAYNPCANIAHELGIVCCCCYTNTSMISRRNSDTYLGGESLWAHPCASSLIPTGHAEDFPFFYKLVPFDCKETRELIIMMITRLMSMKCCWYPVRIILPRSASIGRNYSCSKALAQILWLLCEN